MSNHEDSYMLNYVLKYLNENYELFTFLGKKKTLSFIQDVVVPALDKWDCNDNEILADLSYELGICRCCIQYAELDEDGDDICEKCNEEFFS